MLRNGRVFLLNDTPDSFDGRYFGPTDQDALIGKATPFWLR
jgi:type IV secretory pathway protease TraF